METISRNMYLVVRPDGRPTNLLFNSFNEANDSTETLNGKLDDHTGRYVIMRMEVF